MAVTRRDKIGTAWVRSWDKIGRGAVRNTLAIKGVKSAKIGKGKAGRVKKI